MRGDIVYRVYGLHEDRQQEFFFGAFRTAAEAEVEIAKLSAREINGRNWAEQFHNRGFVIREAFVETDFEIPARPKPRDKYFVKGSPKVNAPGAWNSTIVEVFRRVDSRGGQEKICQFERNHSLFQTFEPFRQDGREFALISRDYAKTAVLDLGSGRVLAEESEKGSDAFCPVGFFVPDWWDVNDGSIIPGNEYWNADREWPQGNFGFVWGCHWGDDASWKVQYLDLSQVQHGVVQRDERFGYVELATLGFNNPCLTPEAEVTRNSAPPPFITVSKRGGATQVVFAVEMRFGLESGRADEWQRLEIANLQ